MNAGTGHGMNRSDLADAIRSRRLALGLTTREAAARVGVSHSMIGMLEQRRVNVTIDMLARIDAALDLGVRVGDDPPVVSRLRSLVPRLASSDLDLLLHMIEHWERKP